MAAAAAALTLSLTGLGVVATASTASASTGIDMNLACQYTAGYDSYKGGPVLSLAGCVWLALRRPRGHPAHDGREPVGVLRERARLQRRVHERPLQPLLLVLRVTGRSR